MSGEENEAAEDITIVVNEKPEEVEHEEDDLELSDSDESMTEDSSPEGADSSDNYQEVKDLQTRRLVFPSLGKILKIIFS